MLRFLGTCLVNAIALWVAVELLSGVTASSTGDIILAGLVLGVANAIIKPILTILSIPLIIITLGLGLFLVSMAMIALTSWLVPGFDAGGFWSVAEATIIVWLVNVAFDVAASYGQR
jgi:putative membrane protein